MSLFPSVRFVASSFALFAGLALVGCSMETDAIAEGQGEAAFSTPTTRELLRKDNIRTLSVAQGPDGSLHAVVDSNSYNEDRERFEAHELWYVTNATPSKEWKATKVFSPRRLISDAVTIVDGNHVAVAFRHGSKVLLLDGLTTASTDLVPEVLCEDSEPYGTLGFAMRNGALHVVTVGGPRLTPTYWSRPAGSKEWRKQVITLPVSFIEGYEAAFTSEVRLDATGRVHLFFGGDVMAYTVEQEPGSGTFAPVQRLPSVAKVQESTLALDATGTPHVVLSAADGLHAVDLVSGEWRLTDVYRRSASYRVSRVRQVFDADGRQSITAMVEKYDSPDQEVRERATLMYFSTGAVPNKLLETVGDPDEKKDIRDVALAVSASGESSVLVVGGGTLRLLE